MALVPVPSDAQPAPFQRATRAAGVPPAVVKLPPAYRSVPITASARTVLFMPEPSADQVAPFHIAMREAGTPPAVWNAPATYRSDSMTASA